LLLSAARTDSTSVVLSFDRNIDPATVVAANFTITETATPANTLAVTAATATGLREVTLTTDPQTPGLGYTLTVGAGVKDDAGVAIDSAADSAEFSGYATPAVLRVTEFNPNISASNGGDLIELTVVAGGSLSGMKVIDPAYATAKTYGVLPDMVLQTGDVIVLHAGLGSTACTEANQGNSFCAAASNTGYVDGAYDFTGTTAISWSGGQVIEVVDSAGDIIDGVPFSKNGISPGGNFLVAYTALVDGGFWMPPAATDADAQAQAVQSLGVGSNAAGNSVSRSSTSLPDSQSDWGTVTSNSQAQASNWGMAPVPAP
jgi:hypothetical protein